MVDWIADDPDPITRDELSDLVDAADGDDAAAAADLADRFAGDLEFGTAGLRGALGGGPNRMNLAVVIRTAAALVTWLRAEGGRVPVDDDSPPQDPADLARRGVAICFDARHRSADFADATAAVFAAAGIRALVLPGPLPTPVLAFAVRHLGCAAGVMVTASHNPPQDNGYKVYDASGRQIVPPSDAQIAAAADAVARITGVPRSGPDDPDIVRLGDDVVQAYVDRAAKVGVVPTARSVEVVYTAMHGVGAATLRRVFAAAGFDPVTEVAEQVEPDPDFPTVAFPNPEEPGALDLGLALARASDAQVLVANDPDADRLGIAVPDRAADGGWRALKGDEIGAILAHHLLRHDAILPEDVLVTTIVSSSLLGKMAVTAGRAYVETLTGFKWVGRAPGPGRHLGFGYEEALGFCVGDLVADKDGITAAVLFAEAVAVLAADGRTVLDVLDELALARGVHHTIQWSHRVEGADGMAQLAATTATLRADPPTELAGLSVMSVLDLADGDPSRNLPPTDAIVLHLEGGEDGATARVIVRPSGTEPKLKAYIEVVEPPVGSPDLLASRTSASTTAEALVHALRTRLTSPSG